MQASHCSNEKAQSIVTTHQMRKKKRNGDIFSHLKYYLCTMKNEKMNAHENEAGGEWKRLDKNEHYSKMRALFAMAINQWEKKTHTQSSFYMTRRSKMLCAVHSYTCLAFLLFVFQIAASCFFFTQKFYGWTWFSTPDNTSFVARCTR